MGCFVFPFSLFKLPLCSIIFSSFFFFLMCLGKTMKLEEQKQDIERQLKALTKQMKVRLRHHDKARLSFYCNTGFQLGIGFFSRTIVEASTSFHSLSSLLIADFLPMMETIIYPLQITFVFCTYELLLLLSICSCFINNW